MAREFTVWGLLWIIFLSVNHDSLTFLIVFVLQSFDFWLLLPFLKSHLWLNFWSFLFWMVLILKFKSCLIMPHPVNLDIVVACRFQWESGSSSWLSICSFTAAIFSQFWPTTSLNTTNETVESIFPIVYWVHHESTLC